MDGKNIFNNENERHRLKLLYFLKHIIFDDKIQYYAGHVGPCTKKINEKILR